MLSEAKHLASPATADRIRQRRGRAPLQGLGASLVIAAVAFATLLSFSSSASAQGGIDVRSSTARTEFPTGLVFTLDASIPGELEEARLVYQIAPDGVRAQAPPECTGGTTIACRYQLANSRRNPLIPGAEVTYFWRLTIGGERQETASQTVTYEDTRHTWQTLSDGNLTLWWYAGGEEEARRVLAAGRESLDRIGALLQTTVDFPVKLFYYESAEEMQPAIVPTASEGVVTLGEVVYSDTAMVSADVAPEEIARHEIAHIVVRQALDGPYDVPAWLNEGTAVFAQSSPLPGQQSALDQAISTGRVISVRSLSSSSSGGISSRVELFYGQSWSLVDFLVADYGEQRFAQLFQAFAEGARANEALQQVYGFDQDGLENAWREQLGLPPRVEPTPEDDPAPQPTDDAPAPDGEGSNAQDGDGVPVLVIVAIVVLTMALAGSMLGAGLLLARRRLR